MCKQHQGGMAEAVMAVGFEFNTWALRSRALLRRVPGNIVVLEDGRTRQDADNGLGVGEFGQTNVHMRRYSEILDVLSLDHHRYLFGLWYHFIHRTQVHVYSTAIRPSQPESREEKKKSPKNKSIQL